jgi:hypothetical protein
MKKMLKTAGIPGKVYEDSPFAWRGVPVVTIVPNNLFYFFVRSCANIV